MVHSICSKKKEKKQAHSRRDVSFASHSRLCLTSVLTAMLNNINIMFVFSWSTCILELQCAEKCWGKNVLLFRSVAFGDTQQFAGQIMKTSM